MDGLSEIAVVQSVLPSTAREVADQLGAVDIATDPFSVISRPDVDAIMMHDFHRNMTAPANFTGQMAITNSAPHEFDIARFVLGCDYAAISVFQPRAVNRSTTGTPVFMVLETISGQLVHIEVNNNARYGYDVRGELVGERGSVFLHAPINSRVNIELRAVERYPED